LIGLLLLQVDSSAQHLSDQQMKSYYRYVPDQSLGVISSPDCNAIFDSTGKLAFTGNIQKVAVWNLRQASLVSLFPAFHCHILS
jgi:hypothetical protein